MMCTSTIGESSSKPTPGQTFTLASLTSRNWRLKAVSAISRICCSFVLCSLTMIVA